MQYIYVISLASHTYNYRYRFTSMQQLIKYILLAFIWLYQRLISPLTPASCRFVPTCSHYAAEAVTKYGVLKGGRLALKRLVRCHPWGGRGYDPVP
ncbi:MAG: membrane protein insertion efficiency factor YidD [Cytophagales bacterium CG18_big_fil_WC_8_21_14_2_50_42_9]|nr:MAG: membrane protein insertion efficiency factor YidD [Cytophagales bacterium CG18_big_fil_WC_8_21_14_2_50_42_9]